MSYIQSYSYCLIDGERHLSCPKVSQVWIGVCGVLYVHCDAFQYE